MPEVCILSSVHNALDNRVFYREALTLRRAGYDVTLVAVHDHDETRDGVQIKALPRVARWKRPLLWLRLYREVRRSGADIFHFHDPELLMVVPVLRLVTRKPTVYDVHEVYADFIQVKEYLPLWLRGPLAWLFRWLEPALARLHSGLIFADDEIARQFAAFKGPKTTLFNYPSRSFVERAAEEAAGTQGRSQVVLYLGSIDRQRGALLMVEAFALVRQRSPAARLLVVGKFTPPSLEDEAKARAAALGLADAVTITGAVQFEQVGAYLMQASLGWVTWQSVPKHRKNIPTKLFEYMAYGLPIVCSDLPSTRPLVAQGPCGLLVEAGDPEQHAQAVVRLLTDHSLAGQLGRTGQELVRSEYNWQAMEPLLLDLYERVLSAGRSRAGGRD
jgi:glycosyltransferase involved in cell wall biosynthesis